MRNELHTTDTLGLRTASAKSRASGSFLMVLLRLPAASIKVSV